MYKEAVYHLSLWLMDFYICHGPSFLLVIYLSYVVQCRIVSASAMSQMTLKNYMYLKNVINYVLCFVNWPKVAAKHLAIFLVTLLCNSVL